ncbi:MAG: DUF1622 domain-containing protein [Hyphomicrobium sp.]|jgi:uncharacterized membrane protein|uniref:DUF1622 domain-containing protein n=1 Tax=Hyphomicrobium sp. TaxID=82 RepID=UPI0025C62EA2|nr:DUF1622 domain-containing protein [Hyphomicrobium sp.]MBX9863926.1 DUF1622 domain-containing protein [Hyphomicrobium sp.]
MIEALEPLTRHAIAAIDFIALIVICFGTIEAAVAIAKALATGAGGHEQRDIWIRYSRWLVAGLTFQLAADIVETSVTTDWESVARLGLIAAIRTLLNYFLERDLAEVRQRQIEAPQQ